MDGCTVYLNILIISSSAYRSIGIGGNKLQVKESRHKLKVGNYKLKLGNYTITIYDTYLWIIWRGKEKDVKLHIRCSPDQKVFISSVLCPKRKFQRQAAYMQSKRSMHKCIQSLTLLKIKRVLLMRSCVCKYSAVNDHVSKMNYIYV
jgi:hypothetical protein